jgi:CRISPR system Cascade subunit CasE
MYLSCLLIDVGDNPDRPRPGRLWLRNLYHVHQRLCMAFPSAVLRSETQKDPRYQHFLQPYRPEHFPEQRHLADKKKTEVEPEVLKQVHSPRDTDAGFLFRIDPQPGGRVMILVQSAVKPDWDYAFHNAGYLLAAPPQVKPFEPSFKGGQHLRFRLAANPTKKIDTMKKAERESHTHEELLKKRGRYGKRVPVRADQLLDWLVGRAESAGFALDKDSTTVQAGYIYMNKERDDGGNRLRSVLYEGVLRVTDAEKFRAALHHGLGPGKAFGFGLLSVAPCHRAPCTL